MNKRRLNEQEYEKLCAIESTKLEVSEKLLKFMQERGISIGDLSEMMGKTSRSPLKRFFNCETTMLTSKIGEICHALEIEMTVEFKERITE